MQDPDFYSENTGPKEIEDVDDFDIVMIVAGSRSYNDYQSFCEYMHQLVSRKDIVDSRIIFVSGMASKGADAMIVRWCEENAAPYVPMPADWEDLSVPGAVVRKNRHGKDYNCVAGHQRNRRMAEIATHLVCFYDGVSPGTKNMIEIGNSLGLDVTVLLVDSTDRW